MLHGEEIFRLLDAADALSGAIIAERVAEHNRTLLQRRRDRGQPEDGSDEP